MEVTVITWHLKDLLLVFILCLYVWNAFHCLCTNLCSNQNEVLVIMCQMTQCMTHCLYNMFSWCIGIIWRTKGTPPSSTLFREMDVTCSSSLQELGTLFFSTLLWLFLTTCHFIVRWFGVSSQQAMAKERWMGLEICWKGKCVRRKIKPRS